MTIPRQDKQALAIIMIVLLLCSFIFIGSWTMVSNEKAYAAEKTPITIELQTGYELSYKNDNFLVETAGVYNPDSDLFSILEFYDDLSAPVYDISATDVIVTNQTSIIDPNSYDLIFQIDHVDYEISASQPLLSVTVQKATLTSESQRFVGLNPNKIYDSTDTMNAYEMIVYVEADYDTTIDFLAGEINSNYGIDLSNSVTFLENNTVFCQTGDEYLIIRIDYNAALKELFIQLGNDGQLANNILDGFIDNVDSWLTSGAYSYQIYQTEQIKNLYFTDFGELITLNGTGYVSGLFEDKNAASDKLYTIDFNGFSHTKYQFDSSSVNGLDGFIDKATLGLEYPIMEMTYGDSNPISFQVDYATSQYILDSSGYSPVINDNEMRLPYMVHGTDDMVSFQYYYNVLTSFYDNDLTDTEVSNYLDNGNFIMDFQLRESGLQEPLNVFNNTTSVSAGVYAYPLVAPDDISNYRFVDPGFLYNVENVNHFKFMPHIQVNPIDLAINDLQIELEKTYNATSDVTVTASSVDYLSGEENLFEINISANFLDSLMVEMSDVANDLFIGGFEIGLTPNYGSGGYSDEELDLMVYNYNIDVHSFFETLATLYSGVTVEVYIDILGTETWITLNDYETNHSDEEILDYRLTGNTANDIQIVKADLTLSALSNQQMVYGNDIMADFEFGYESFYQINPQDIFSIDYQLKDISETIVYENANNVATDLIPGSYFMQLNSYTADSAWELEYANNYNIIINTDWVGFDVLEGQLYYQIEDQEKIYGELDSQFEFLTIEGARDSDILDLEALLSRTSSDQFVGAYIEIELLDHSYYNYELSSQNGQLTITKRTVQIEPLEFEVEYGEADSATNMFDIIKMYTVGDFPQFPEQTFDLEVEHQCLVTALDISENYVHEVLTATIINTPHNNNMEAQLVNGENKIKIIPASIDIDLSVVGGDNNAYQSLQKTYDDQPLFFRLRDEHGYSYNYFDYQNDLPGVLTQQQIGEPASYIQVDLPYGERIFYASIDGYQNGMGDTLYDRVKVGEKTLFISDIVVAAIVNDETVQRDVSNYDFSITSGCKGEILKRNFEVNTKPFGEVYKKTYDGEPYYLPYSSDMTDGLGLLNGHTILAESIWFESQNPNIGNNVPFVFKENIGGMKIYDSEDRDITENYQLATIDFNTAAIEKRIINVAIENNDRIQHIYDATRIYIDLSDGKVYSQNLSGADTEIGTYNLIFSYSYSNTTQPNSIASVFVDGHFISGEYITPDTNAGVKKLIEVDGSVIIFDGASSTYTSNYSLNVDIRADVQKRDIEIDIFKGEAIDYIPEETYDGEIVYVTVEQAMINQGSLVQNHTLSGERGTANANVLLDGEQAAAKEFSNSYNITIEDQSLIDVTANYNISFVDRYVIINQRVLIIDITQDLTVSKEKYYDGDLFEIGATDAMGINIVAGETIEGGILATEDANVYTLDEFGDIIYNGENYVSKELMILSKIQITKANSDDSSDNYTIELQNNFVDILPKPVDVIMENEYDMTVIYKGSLHEFPVTDAMITEHNDPLTNGLIAGHSVSPISSPLIAASEAVGENIEIIYNDIYIGDETITHNYQLNYPPTYIDIDKRPIEIDVSLSENDLFKTYDTLRYEINLDNSMDASKPWQEFVGLAEGQNYYHNLSGIAFSLDELVDNDKILDYEVSIWDNSDELTLLNDNYDITFAPNTIAINKKQVEIDLNVELEGDWHKKVYDEQALVVEYTATMFNGLEGDDYLGEGSYIQTTNVNFGVYDMAVDGQPDIYINRQGVAENLKDNYDFVYPNDGGKVEILKRNILVSVRHSDLWNRDQGYLISGLSDVYYDDFYTVDYHYYYIDIYDDDINGAGFQLVNAHSFADGNRITQQKVVGEEILLVDNENAVIINASYDNVTDNYDISYEDSYFNIYKRKILLDVARDPSGSTDNYDANDSFIKSYDRHLFEIDFHTNMVIAETSYPMIVSGHQITNGSLVSQDDFVARDSQGDVISKPLVWGTNIVIEDALGVDVTDNYDIDIEDTQLNFVERVVTIQPQTIVIDILNDIPPHTKEYDGQPFDVTIVNSMVVDLKDGEELISGFMGDYNQSGALINRDNIRINSGYLITEDANVAYEGENVVEKSLDIGQDIIIENPDKMDVTINYDVHYYQNVYDLGTWYNIESHYENYEDHLPVAVITRKDLQLKLKANDSGDEYRDKAQKYYDGTPLDIMVSFQNGQLTLESGDVINDNLEELIELTGLVDGEYAKYRLNTSDGNVAEYKPWSYSVEEVLNGENQDSISNYNVKFLRESFALIRPRQIIVDVNQINSGFEIAQHIYDADFYTVSLENAMVIQNSQNNRVLNNDESLGILPGHTITGIRRSISMDVGTRILVPDTPIAIYDELDNDITSQYMPIDADNQYVQILKAEVNIDLSNNMEIEREKIYDGQPFIIPLNYENLVDGLKSESHYVAQGVITTQDSSAEVDKQTFCDIGEIIIKQNQETGLDVDVTHNYNFTYTQRNVTILQRQVTIMGYNQYYKSYNDTTEITLQDKHYRFAAGDIIEGDTVKLISYTAAFSSPSAGGTGESITVTDLQIDNDNYSLINDSFNIIGHIVEFTPQVSVEDSRPIMNTNGVIFSYDGQPKTPTYVVSGLEGVNVQHSVKYQLNDAPEGEFLDSSPVNAGLYKMILESEDDDYPYWSGDIIMIQINPAEVTISFTGSQNQVYGEVANITAKAQGAGGLNTSIDVIIQPDGIGYSCPEAGSYTVIASYNSDNLNPNYQPAERRIPFVIEKRSIEVEYGLSDFIYDGTTKSVRVNIKSGEILPQDISTVTDDSLVLSYSRTTVKQAGNYDMTVDIDNNNYQISNNTHSFTIAQKDLVIKALINSASRIILNEGDDFVVSIEYSGFVGGENRAHLLKPAFLPYVPKTAITEMEVMPFGAESYNYSLEYVPAYITILERKVEEIESSNGLAMISGEYGSYTSLTASRIEANVSDPIFYQINEKIQRNFTGTALLSDYNVEFAYRLNLAAGQEEDSTGQTSQIKLRLPENMQDVTNLVVLHFSEDGDYEIIPTYREGEHIVFNADGMGDFVIMTPKSGLSQTLVILLFAAPVALFGLFILFYMLFRRKYS